MAWSTIPKSYKVPSVWSHDFGPRSVVHAHVRVMSPHWNCHLSYLSHCGATALIHLDPYGVWSRAQVWLSPGPEQIVDWSWTWMSCPVLSNWILGHGSNTHTHISAYSWLPYTLGPKCWRHQPRTWPYIVAHTAGSHYSYESSARQFFLFFLIWVMYGQSSVISLIASVT